MSEQQQVGGLASLINAATFIFGMILFFTFLNAADYDNLEVEPIRHVAFLVENQSILYLWYLVIYIVFGVSLVVLTLALHARLKAGAEALTQTATVFGIIWAVLVIGAGMVANVGAGVVIQRYAVDPEQAASAWLALRIVVYGLGGGNEIVGGLWIFLVSWAALGPRRLPRALNYLGLLVGGAGIVTTVPALSELGAIFGLGSIVWFIWVGAVLLRSRPEQGPATATPMR